MHKLTNNAFYTRKSGIELLKCAAILFVVISHLLPLSEYNDNPYIIDISVASENINIFICVVFKYLGQIGNAIFIVCSSYFLVDSNKLKPAKVFNLLGINLSVNLIFVFIFILSGINLAPNEIIKGFFPTMLSNNWYVTCYVIFYLIHPYLNMIINSVKQTQLLAINILGIIAYCCLQMLKNGILFYNSLIGFIVLYFITAYMKKYLKKFSGSLKYNIFTAIFSICCLIGIIFATNLLGLKIELFKDKMLHYITFTNPLIVIFSLSMFNVFQSCTFSSKAVNYVSSLSMIIYIIHENILLRTYTRQYVFEKIYECTINAGISYINNIAWISLCTSIITFVLCIIAATIYRFTIEKLVVFLSNCILKKGFTVFSKFMSELCKIK